MPTRTPVTGLSLSSIISRTRSAAASVRLMIFGAMFSPSIVDQRYSTPIVGALPRVQGHLGFVAHPARVPRGIEHHVDGDVLDAFHRHGGIFHPARHVAGHRTARRRQD